MPSHLPCMVFHGTLKHKQPFGAAVFYLHISEPTNSSVAAVLLMRYCIHPLADTLE